jgi:hypothetical protein
MVMNYQPPKALQAQTKNRDIKPAIQNKLEFDSKILFTCKYASLITGIGVEKSVMKLVSPNLLIFGINLFPVF